MEQASQQLMSVIITHTIILPFENIMGEAEGAIVAPAEQAHFYCPVCGEVWAHAITTHALPRHFFYPRRCPTHGNGTLGVHFNPQRMSRSLLIREVLLLTTSPRLANNGLEE